MRETLDCPACDLSGLDVGDETAAPNFGLAVEVLLPQGQDGPAPEVALLSDQDAFRFERPASAPEPHQAGESSHAARSANVIPLRRRAASARREMSR
jgi:hypothetical protein